MTSDRIFNFGAGPCTLPLPALQKAQRDLLCLPGSGMSVLEISHRSPAFDAIIDKAQDNLRSLLGVPAGYKILFLQGGATLQFSMVALNLLRAADKPADYVVTGVWGEKAVKEAQREGEVRVVWNGKAGSYSSVPQPAELAPDAQAAYLHYTSNETIQGVQFPQALQPRGATLVCDCSSDFLSRPLPVADHGLLYAGAQKNAGPAGVTIVIVREALLERAPQDLHTMLDYRIHAQNNSMYNTPPVFAIYLLQLVTDWLRNEIGGLQKMAELNARKAGLLYAAIDACAGFYRGHARADSRSQMNVTFRMPSEQLERDFLAQAAARGLQSLEGHRSVGGVRASLYNAMPLAGAQALRDFMVEFCAQHAQ